MSMKSLRVLLVDDNVFKTIEIKRALEFGGATEVMMVDNQAAVWEALENDTQFDLIVTDMHYPLEKGKVADHSAGFILIEKMKEKEIDIPIIICSTRNFISKDTFGTVWYSKQRDMRLEFKNLLTKLKETERKIL